MKVKQVVWPKPVINKLKTFSNEHFTLEESYDYIVQVIIDTEDLLLNPVLGQTYVEEFGEYQGFARIVVRKFRVYYSVIGLDIVITAVMFPGEK
jgi:hypothetical protein